MALERPDGGVIVDVTGVSQRLRQLEDGELELLRLVAAGHYDREIADSLRVSQRTVKRRVALLLDRLGLERRIQAAYVAGAVGLLDGSGSRRP